jgi:iron(III) transport system permease protein
MELSVSTLTEPADAPAASAAGDMRQGALNRLKGRLNPQFIILGLAVLIVAGLVLVPLVYLVNGTFFSNGQFTLEFFRTAYGAGGLGGMIWNSVVYSVGSTILAMVCGTALAYLVARTDVPFKGFVYAAALVPLVIPGVLHTVAWIFLASPEIGLINWAIAPVVGDGFLNVFSMKGMVFVEGIHASPLIFLLMFAAFKNMDSSLEESALMSGASKLKVFFSITLPLVKPALLLAALIMFIRAMSSFEVPQLLGSSAGIWVFTSRIYNALVGFPADYGSAGAYSTGLLVILGLFAVIQWAMGKKSKSYQTVTGKGFRPTTVSLGRWRKWAGLGVIAYFVVTSVMPLGALVYTSLLGYFRQPDADVLSSFTLKNYEEIFTDSKTLDAFRNSILLAIGSATIVMVLTSLIAWIVVRGRVRGSGLVNSLANLPLGIPGLIMGVALLFTYLRVPLPIYGSLLILLIAYVTVFLPYGITYASSAMYQISGELEESAQVSGAGFWRIFTRVTLPLLMPGLIAGWTFIVLLAVRELGASLLLYSPGKEVLSIVIWEEWGDGKIVQLAALGVVMTVMLLAIVLVARKLGAKIGVQSR